MQLGVLLLLLLPVGARAGEDKQLDESQRIGQQFNLTCDNGKVISVINSSWLMKINDTTTEGCEGARYRWNSICQTCGGKQNCTPVAAIKKKPQSPCYNTIVGENIQYKCLKDHTTDTDTVCERKTSTPPSAMTSGGSSVRESSLDLTTSSLSTSQLTGGSSVRESSLDLTTSSLSTSQLTESIGNCSKSIMCPSPSELHEYKALVAICIGLGCCVCALLLIVLGLAWALCNKKNCCKRSTPQQAVQHETGPLGDEYAVPLNQTTYAAQQNQCTDKHNAPHKQARTDEHNAPKAMDDNEYAVNYEGEVYGEQATGSEYNYAYDHAFRPQSENDTVGTGPDDACGETPGYNYACAEHNVPKDYAVKDGARISTADETPRGSAKKRASQNDYEAVEDMDIVPEAKLQPEEDYGDYATLDEVAMDKETVPLRKDDAAATSASTAATSASAAAVAASAGAASAGAASAGAASAGAASTGAASAVAASAVADDDDGGCCVIIEENDLYG